MAKKSKKRSGTKPRAASSRKARKLSSGDLAKLKRIAAKGDFDGEAALDLDTALLNAIDKGVGNNPDYDALPGLSEPQGAYFAAWWLEGEVNNGGFHQFFLNKGPGVAARALAFHKERGPKDIAGLLERAIKALPGGRLPRDYQAMMDALVPDDPKEDERIMGAMDRLDSKFFEREETPSLLEVRLRYVLDHAAEFFA